MDILRWLARSAARLRWRRASGNSTIDSQKDRMLAARALRSQLSPHLLRDIGADDG